MAHQTNAPVPADLRQAEERTDVDVLAVFVVGIVGTVLVLLAVVLLQAYYFKSQDAQSQEAYAEPLLDVKKVKNEQLGLLSDYSIPEPGKGTIRIPIDRAIEIVAREGAHAEPAPAVPSAPVKEAGPKKQAPAKP